MSERPTVRCFFQAEDGIRGRNVTGVQTCALPILAEGGDMQQLIRRAKENKKPEGFNFQLELKKMISRIFDSSEGEIRDSYYGIEITVYKANGKAKSFYTEIESDKVKEYGWLKRATHSLAMLPRTKDDKETLDNMIQECIESEDA